MKTAIRATTPTGEKWRVRSTNFSLHSAEFQPALATANPPNRERRTISFFALAVVLILALALSACHQAGPSGQKYHCPMHPTYIDDKPGDCPICGMRLVPIEEKTAPTATPGAHAAHSTAKYYCEMDPEVGSDDSEARCPKCGMKLVPNPDYQPGGAAVAAASGERKLLFYRNPMNPEVTSPVPAKDEMGMDYVPVYSDEIAKAGGGVPGLAPVEATAEGLELAGVRTMEATIGRISHTIRTVGTITADETRVRHIHTKISGWVEKLNLNYTGQYVKEGEPILSLYSQELYSGQLEFLSALENAAKLERSNLPQVKQGAEDLVAAARSRLELFDVPAGFIDQVQRDKKPMHNVTLAAPVSGYVTVKDVVEGHEVEPGNELFTITDLSRVWVEADVYEYEAPYVQVGQTATIASPYASGASREARVSYIYPFLNTESRTLKVRFELDNGDLSWRPGMYVDVNLSTQTQEGVIIADTAIMDTGARQIVFVSTGPTRFEPRLVRVGTRDEGRALVLSGVAAGERVVVRANFLLDSESRLRAAIGAH